MGFLLLEDVCSMMSFFPNTHPSWGEGLGGKNTITHTLFDVLISFTQCKWYLSLWHIHISVSSKDHWQSCDNLLKYLHPPCVVCSLFFLSLGVSFTPYILNTVLWVICTPVLQIGTTLHTWDYNFKDSRPFFFYCVNFSYPWLILEKLNSFYLKLVILKVSNSMG